jgi:FecR protein
VPKFVDQLAIDQADHVLWAAAPLFPGHLMKFNIEAPNFGIAQQPNEDYTAESTQAPAFNGHGVAVDAEHNVYLADTEGARVMAFGECKKAPVAGAAATRDAHAAAINEVRIVAVIPGVQYHKEGSPDDDWCEVEKGTVLKQGDEISTDPDGSVTLAFADNSTITLRNTTQLKIASFFTEGGVVRTEIVLKMGEVAAKVNKSEATKSDARIKTPTGTASVRGTTFSVFYDPTSKAMLESTQKGNVSVDPARPGLKTVTVGAGKEVEVTPTSITKPAKIGKAGARAGNNRRNARARVLKVIAKGDGPCGASTPRETAAFAVKPAKRGWAVSVKVIGKVHGTATWLVAGPTVKPGNMLARKLATGCTTR